MLLIILKDVLCKFILNKFPLYEIQEDFLILSLTIITHIAQHYNETEKSKDIIHVH